MIFKSFIIEKDISLLDSYYAVLFYGENIGLKDDLKVIIKNRNKDSEQISFYQNDLLKNPNLLSENVSNTSLFSKKKIIIINDFSEKLKNVISEIVKKKTEDVRIFLFSENLDKKSITRSNFEKEKGLAIIPCYQDNEKTLSIYLKNKLNGFEGLNQELINLLIKNSGEDRKVLSQEIEKIKGLFLNKKIEEEKLIKLINDVHNVDFDQLRDSCLEANKTSLNKNLGSISLQNEKAYLYLSNLNNRIEKLLILNELLIKNKNIDIAIETIKPKIFWKDKPIFKKQLKIWNGNKLVKAKRNILRTEIIIKTRMNYLSDILIKKLLIELCGIASSTS
tara:strand:- start:43 stop:1047 length:1005 start_codon:yes stop_codon:yes gene_type:complete